MLRGRRRKKELAATIDHSRKLVAARPRQEAIEFLERAVRKFPEDAEIRLIYATVLLAFRPEGVAAEAAKAVELGPEDPSILMRAAHLLLNAGETELARSCAARANELARADFVLMSGLINLNGRIAAIDGEDDLAEEKLRLAVEMDPPFSSFAVDLARFLLSRGRPTEATAVVNEALNHVNEKSDLERLRASIARDS